MATHLGRALGTAHGGRVAELNRDAAGEAGMDPSWVLEEHGDRVIHAWGEAQDKGKPGHRSCLWNLGQEILSLKQQ